MTILDTIVEKKREEVEIRKSQSPLSSFVDNLEKSDISFYDALQGKNRVHLIAEVKKASPSKGLIAKNFDLEKTVQLYNRYASAMSILTDESFFQGSFYNLETARKNSNLPLLCKDFIIDEYQIYEARKYGANAILLIAAILTQEEMKHFYSLATDLNMDVLFEVHDKEELDKTLPLNPRIVGVNNRNLKDFSIDYELTNKLAKFIPEECVIVAESGIETWEDVQGVQGTADAMLVGSSIMGAPSPKEKIHQLTQLPQIKICGITNTEDALEACKAGASYIGLIFAPSPRKIDKQQAQEVIEAIRNNHKDIRVGGVFVNQDNCFDIATDLNLDFVQLHGDEGTAFVRKNKTNFEGEIWRSISVTDSINLSKEELIDIFDHYSRILFDTAGTSDQRGGSGKTFNWNLVEELSEFPIAPHQIIVAGGINPENIQDARKTYAWTLDVSSGVEASKGKKDPQKLKDLFWNLKK